MKNERTIELSAIQRIGLENLLGEQRGKREDNRVFYNIRQKIKVSAEERSTCMPQLPDGRIMFNETAASKIAPKRITFNDDEVRRLVKLGDTIEIPVGIMDWFEPLLQELEMKENSGITQMPA